MLLFGTLYWRTGAGTPAPAPPPAPDATPPPRGTVPWLLELPSPRTRKEISRERERYGIRDELALAAIAEVAARQAERLEIDRQKQFDELYRELELRKIEFDSRYLEALALEREALIDEEIGRILRRRLYDEEVLLLLLIAAASTL